METAIRIKSMKDSKPGTGASSRLLRFWAASASTTQHTLAKFPGAGACKQSLAICLAFWSVVGLSWSAPRTATITTFDVPGAAYGTSPASINPKGEITGSYFVALGYAHAFVRSSDGVITTFDVPGALTTSARSINPAGEITGFYSGFGLHSYVRSSRGIITTFNVPRSLLDGALSINAAGEITGSFDTYTGRYPRDRRSQGYVRSPRGIVTTFGVTFEVQGATVPVNTSAVSINDSGEITGSAGGLGFVRSGSGVLTTFSVPGGQGTSPTGINRSGEISGFYFDAAARVFRGFVRASRGGFSTFDAPGAGTGPNQSTGPSQGTFPFSINSKGEVTGYYIDAGGVAHGFVRDSQGTFTTFDAPDAGNRTRQGTFARSINPSGDITGSYTDSNDLAHGFVRIH